MPKEWRSRGIGVLGPAALSACLDASVLAVPAAGAIVSTVLNELGKAFMLKKWFHGEMSAKEAEHLMMEKGRNGSFLVRESLAHPGEYVLSVRVRGRVSHVMIKKVHDKYDVGSGEQFDDLVGLIEHYRSYPMIETSGDVLRLLQPISGTRLRVRNIDRKIQDMKDKEDVPKVEFKCGFDGEYQALKALENRVYTTHEACKQENATKNRYRNILPYDQTRVILSRDNDPSATDYINASFIRSPHLYGSTSSVQSSNESLDSVHSLSLKHPESKKSAFCVSKSLSDEALREIKKYIKLDKLNGNIYSDAVKDKVYIATQGCLSNTVEDFWRMVWQQDVRIIAMITNEEEKGKKKCERYWPSSGEETKYDKVSVKALSESCFEDYLLRQFSVSYQGNCRHIYQYHFTAWPDHDVPSEPGGVLAFVDDINKTMRHITERKDAPEQNAICVHCSAGVGRTGTFIVLDMLIDKIKTAGLNCDIDVFDTVKMVRAQRAGLVQNKSQYTFIYLALQQYVENKAMGAKKKIYTSEA